MTAPDTATQRQIDAARPDRSTWLSANAGSGKTKVLTDRVARLLLDQVQPQNVLCLTYTKAAASEMQNRLFARLGAWAMLNDAALSDELRALGIETALDAEALRAARRLFARAIEAPGGLKIQTIHSFCAALLRRFPLEAGVSPQFVEMEERTSTLLRAEIIEQIAAGPEAGVLYDLAEIYTGETLDELTRDIASRAPDFERPRTDAGLARAVGLAPDMTEAQLLKEVFLGGEMAMIARLCTHLKGGGVQDQKAGERLAKIAAPGLAALPILETVLLTGAGAKEPFCGKIDAFPSKPTRAKMTDMQDALNALILRVEAARPTRLALKALTQTKALHRFAQVFLPAYAAAKEAHGWLDFDDLILRAKALLTRSDVAAWVLYRLDGGIDHILVDEAQDTSPTQWQVIDRLAQEFTSGQGARDVPRTIFVVGDKKQSIYSFQGADPREFDRMQRDFSERLENAGTPLQSQQLEHSFRSSAAILSVVDATFDGREESGFAPDQSHMAFKYALPGRVDIWPVAEPEEVEDDPPWHAPVDVTAPNDPAVLLAERVAANIQSMIIGAQAIPDGKGAMRPVQPGDFLILVQRRSEIFHEIIRACKAADLPIAGADRLKVAGELAVKDLAALLSFLATPEDDLSLGTALRSPLFGWDEAALYDLAHNRTQKFLWPALRDRAAEFPETLRVLRDLLGQADFLRPYELIERILTRHDGRRKLLGRLGGEAEDGIDALLSQALAYERRSVDSLTGFLTWMETDDLTIKRQMDSSGDRIRVMTVHGAKGLESPIVILPDTAERVQKRRGQILSDGDVPLWRPRAQEAPAALSDSLSDEKAREAAEEDRLLYVAMTRAETWLIAACVKPQKGSGAGWFEKIEAGAQRAGAMPMIFDGAEGLRLEHGDWAETVSGFSADAPEPPQPLAACFTQPAALPAPLPEAITPSELGGAKALPGDAGLDEESAKRRGRQMHLLLEVLPTAPDAEWSSIAQRLFLRGPDAAEAAELPGLLEEATRALKSPNLAELFAPGTLAEVAVTAPLPHGRLHGIIDRLVITDTMVRIVDFKTNAEVPTTPEACPEGILRQMGAYAAALAQIYPSHGIETAILWTRTTNLMVLPHDLVTDALGRTQIS
ncbi:double-strand break repair helicase AddA [Roseovarius sp. LXJ103]|uniref:double-strand break repair helicase AddA n=1 Tax=Roseovarius carneus TaxID=2853164 RepID=UPI000D61AD7B|nr:double-strand break repair helicase AddA [Roseovarius carneus]MBZ8117935.1 double-strand break repair helicase AddA [Roseovarius carneus]PWE36311.1 double-strand break repair helicase AddA [Pelagicola sp. LXJ1103]